MDDIAIDKRILPCPQVAGFTLVEILLSIAVMAILLAVTAPAFKATIMNSRISAQTDGFVNALNYARNTAVSQNINVVVCPAGTAGSTTCGTNWRAGWIAVSQPTAGANFLLLSFFTGANDPILSNVPIGGVAANTVTFDPRGLATTQANFKTCDTRGGAFARSVEVLPTGFVQTNSTMGVAVWDSSALACP